jgi:DivIVA domain-containing protein
MTQQNAAFRTVMRGYEPGEVDRAFADLHKALEQARAESGNNSVAVTKLTSQIAQLEEQANAYRARIAASEQQE